MTSKPNHLGITTGMGLPDIQNLVNKAVPFRERELDIVVLRQNANKISFGMWEEGRGGGKRREEEIWKGRKDVHTLIVFILQM